VTLVAFEGCMYDDSIASCMFNFSHVMYAVSPRYSSSCVESDSIITVSSGFPGDQGSQLRCFDSSHWRIQDKLSQATQPRTFSLRISPPLLQLVTAAEHESQLAPQQRHPSLVDFPISITVNLRLYVFTGRRFRRDDGLWTV
jgi:hypothetical protein